MSSVGSVRKPHQWAYREGDGLTWEGDLLRGSLLEKQSILRIEEKDGEGAVQQSFVDVLHEMADLLACTAYWKVILIEDYADLVHETDLLFIVALEILILMLILTLTCCDRRGKLRVDLREET